jgi:hypothetical protein
MSLDYNDDTHEMTAIRTNMEKDVDEYINVSAPTNLPGGYELNVDSDGTHWTVQVVSMCNNAHLMMIRSPVFLFMCMISHVFLRLFSRMVG